MEDNHNTPKINCPFYESDGMCDHHASRHKVFFGIITTLDECLLTLGDERIQECDIKKRWDKTVKQPPKSL
jgi:hypothetical protein